MYNNGKILMLPVFRLYVCKIIFMGNTTKLWFLSKKVAPFQPSELNYFRTRLYCIQMYSKVEQRAKKKTKGSFKEAHPAGMAMRPLPTVIFEKVSLSHSSGKPCRRCSGQGPWGLWGGDRWAACVGRSEGRGFGIPPLPPRVRRGVSRTPCVPPSPRYKTGKSRERGSSLPPTVWAHSKTSLPLNLDPSGGNILASGGHES